MAAPESMLKSAGEPLLMGLSSWVRLVLSLALTVGVGLSPSPSPARAQSDSCPEPNNGFNNACFVGPAAPAVQGFISSAGDVDAFKFEVNVPLASVDIQLGNLPADYDLHLFDQYGSFMTESTIQGPTPEVLQLPLIRGSYFVFVNAAQGQFNPGQPYSLMIRVNQIDENAAGFGGDACLEPNGDFGQACQLTIGVVAFGNLESEDDVDFFAFGVEETGTRVTVRLGDAPIDFFYALLRADGSVIDTTDPSSTLVGRLDAGQYYVQVGRLGGEPNPVAYAVLLTASSPTVAPLASSKDPCPEPNDDNEQACNIGIDAPAIGHISNPADHDRYRFDVSGGRTWIHLELTDLPADYDLEVQDENGYLRASHNSGSFPEAVDLVVEPGTYYVVVYSLLAQGSDEQPYRLALGMVPDDGTQRPAATVLFADNFNSIDAHFPSASRNLDRYEVGYYDGEYVVRLHVSASPDDSAPEGDEPANTYLVGSYQLDLDARLTQLPSEEGGFTVSFNWQNDGNTYELYVDVVNSGGAGRLMLGKWQDGRYEALTDWIASGAIRKDSATNHVTIRVEGASLSVSVNGQAVASASGSTYSSGDLALGAFSFDRPTEARFDNVLVTVLP